MFYVYTIMEQKLLPHTLKNVFRCSQVLPYFISHRFTMHPPCLGYEDVIFDITEGNTVQVPHPLTLLLCLMLYHCFIGNKQQYRQKRYISLNLHSEMSSLCCLNHSVFDEHFFYRCITSVDKGVGRISFKTKQC